MFAHNGTGEVEATRVGHLGLLKVTQQRRAPDRGRCLMSTIALFSVRFHFSFIVLRKFNFTNRVIPIWNSLSNRVDSADTVNCFKNRLDKFWSNQEVLYNHKADLHGTGNRSILE